MKILSLDIPAWRLDWTQNERSFLFSKVFIESKSCMVVGRERREGRISNEEDSYM
jgi:hypothetical protein